MSSDNNSFFIYKIFGNMVKCCFYIQENSTLEQVLRDATSILEFNLNETLNSTKVTLNGEEVQLTNFAQKGIYLISGCKYNQYEIKSIKPFANNLD